MVLPARRAARLERSESNSFTSGGIAYDRAGPRDGLPIVFLHAGIADRLMRDSLWPGIAEHDVVRLDFRSEQVASLLLCPPGGSLIPEATPDLRNFIQAETAALNRADLDAAVEANLIWWVEGLHRQAGDVDAGLRESVRRMQRQAFEVAAAWDDVEEAELDPPALTRLANIFAPTLVLQGALDLDAIHIASSRILGGITVARSVDWNDVAQLPTMERPADFLALLQEWVSCMETGNPAEA